MEGEEDAEDVFGDLEAELDRLEVILGELDAAAWAAPSGSAGWTVADVVLHLAQTEEAVAATVAGAGDRLARGAETVEEMMGRWVREERAASDVAFQRWRAAWGVALDALRGADPDRPLMWAEAPLRPKTLATTRIAEHWAHGLDITVPLAISFPDTARLRHVAWLAHRSLPYAFGLVGEPPHDVFCELTAPDGSTTWRYGPPDADSVITGPAGAFCRVGAQRLAPEESGLEARGPHAGLALRVLRNFAA